MMKVVQLVRLSLLGAIFYSSASFGVALDVQGGILFGASEVDVNGTLYDVQFLDGTCIELYDGCDQNTDFPFTNPLDLNDGALLEAAMTALLEQVFIDSTSGAFDTSPELTNDCTDINGCFVFTPLWVNVGANSGGLMSALNANVVENSSNRDHVSAGGGGGFRDNDTYPPPGFPDRDQKVYAVWSESAVVPIPAAAWLFGTGLLGLVGIARCKKAA